jgi:hypothetical protein
MEQVNIPRLLEENKHDIINWEYLYEGQAMEFCDFSGSYKIIEEICNDFSIKPILKQDCIHLYENENTLYKGIILSMLWGGINFKRNAKSLNSNLHKILNYDKQKLVDNAFEVKEILLKENYAKAFSLYKSDPKFRIDGIGPSYFTKIFYFLLLAGKRGEFKKCPLIFDKWTMNGYAALLLDANKHKAVKYISEIIIKLSGKTGIVSFKERILSEIYENYVNDLYTWGNALNIDPLKIEQYLFGFALNHRQNKDKPNPRKIIWANLLNALTKDFLYNRISNSK